MTWHSPKRLELNVPAVYVRAKWLPCEPAHIPVREILSTPLLKESSAVERDATAGAPASSEGGRAKRSGQFVKGNRQHKRPLMAALHWQIVRRDRSTSATA